MPYAIEHWNNKGIVVNTKTGKHFSNKPIAMDKAKAQLRLLESKMEKEKKGKR
jgi:hypothetical protein